MTLACEARRQVLVVVLAVAAFELVPERPNARSGKCYQLSANNRYCEKWSCHSLEADQHICSLLCKGRTVLRYAATLAEALMSLKLKGPERKTSRAPAQVATPRGTILARSAGTTLSR